MAEQRSQVSSLSQFVKEADQIEAALDFISERIRNPVAAPYIGVGPVRKKRVDEKGEILNPTVGNRNKPDLFGKPLPGTAQEAEQIDKEIRRAKKYGLLPKEASLKQAIKPLWNATKPYAYPIAGATAAITGIGGGFNYIRKKYRAKQKAERIADMMESQQFDDSL